MSLCATQFVLGDFIAAVESAQQAIHICLHGKEHPNIAEIFDIFGFTQDSLSALNATLESFKPIFHLFAEKQASIPGCQLAAALGDVNPSLFWSMRNVYRHFFRQNRASIYNMSTSLCASKVTTEDLEAEMESICCHLDNCLKLGGEESKSATDCHYNLGITQQSLGDFEAALGPLVNLLSKLFGEESAVTAFFLDFIGKFQSFFGDCHAALNSN